MQNIYEVYFPGYLILNINTSLLLNEMTYEPTCSMQNEVFLDMTLKKGCRSSVSFSFSSQEINFLCFTSLFDLPWAFLYDMDLGSHWIL